MPNRQRLTLLVAAAIVAVLGFVLASSGGSGTQAPPTVRHLTVRVAGGKPVGGVVLLTANKGDTLSLTVTSDVADEIHIHGYDLHRTVAARGAVTFMFKATIDGNFVIELESRKEQIASLTVRA